MQYWYVEAKTDFGQASEASSDLQQNKTSFGDN